MKYKLAKLFYYHLSGEPGEHCAPGGECRLEFGEIDDDKPMFVATTRNNDGYEVWIAYNRGKWLMHFGSREARQLAWFILWDWWIVSTWCGIKRRLWFWANREMLEYGRNQYSSRKGQG